MKTLALGLFSLGIFISACEDPAANKPHANVSNTTITNTATNTTTADAKTESLAITPENSRIEFTGSKVTGHNDGGFKKFNGTIVVVNEKVEGSKVTVDIETSSLFADQEKLSEHLKSPDFFDVAKFSKANFTSANFVPDTSKGPDNYTVTGDLDLHGQKKSITFPASIKIGPDDVTVNAEFSINRKDFGIVFQNVTNDLIRDDVVIRLNLKAPRKK
ncbi:MAG: YceI family protein [Candidatus Binatia bacterium]